MPALIEHACWLAESQLTSSTCSRPLCALCGTSGYCGSASAIAILTAARDAACRRSVCVRARCRGGRRGWSMYWRPTRSTSACRAARALRCQRVLSQCRLQQTRTSLRARTDSAGACGTPARRCKARCMWRACAACPGAHPPSAAHENSRASPRAHRTAWTCGRTQAGRAGQPRSRQPSKQPTAAARSEGRQSSRARAPRPARRRARARTRASRCPRSAPVMVRGVATRCTALQRVGGRTVPSVDAEAMRRPSAATANDVTCVRCACVCVRARARARAPRPCGPSACRSHRTCRSAPGTNRCYY